MDPEIKAQPFGTMTKMVAENGKVKGQKVDSI